MSVPQLAVVMAAGEGTRWDNHLGTPKHLVSVEGEVLLKRTVQQLTDRVPEVWVASPATEP